MSFEIPIEKSVSSIRTVKIGATAEEGGTRTSTVTLGGSNCMPFYNFEGSIPNPPVIAMEVFDTVPRRYPKPLMDIYADVINNPADMAKKCVEEFGAQMISIRLDGTHPDRGNKSPDEASDVVKSVLESVGVPLIITGHANFEKINEVIRKVAETASGENCLINWVEQDNYKTITAICLAHGHCIAALSPIDVNIAKQMNIQLTDMSFPAEKIVMDPMTSSTGYGLEYSYSIMERIRITGLGGDEMLRMPIMINPGYESSLSKEAWALGSDIPEWGDENSRTPFWEIATASSLMLAGAELMILYHPKTVEVMRGKIEELSKAAVL